MPRLPLVVLVTALLLGTAAGIAGVVVATGSSGPRGAARTTAVGAGAEPFALQVLRGWDRRRARAYARGDPQALADLYVRGSRTADADLAVLRGYRARGLRVTSMRTQVLGMRLLQRSRSRLTLLVTDVLSNAVAQGPSPDQQWGLPTDRPSQRKVLLRLVAGEWLVAEAYVVEDEAD